MTLGLDVVTRRSIGRTRQFELDRRQTRLIMLLIPSLGVPMDLQHAGAGFPLPNDPVSVGRETVRREKSTQTGRKTMSNGSIHQIRARLLCERQCPSWRGKLLYGSIQLQTFLCKVSALQNYNSSLIAYQE